ncbi:putative membrane protein YdjX (TVP38/TMEM64 family) [Rhodopirellula rubra]|uniref:TVP38/TMEM64 family membrane protein n=1 Tax=Aporhodopirellula rubra TaxID=980271 RepID=A0A7W5DWZ6_9BACT|nr:VTT domain-containing protein [Aporhodopirellula rubra]MBB3206086.1 putative membrane protein YdjX (TVP38/TMEM64 family) [Aporhodopirellula rubra]
MSSPRRFSTRLIRSPVFYTILVILVAGWFTMQWLAENDIEQIRQTYGLNAVAILLPTHVLMALTPFPSDLFSIANGALYGVTIGTGLSWIGWYIAALIQFGLGRRARKDFDLEQEVNRIPSWLRGVPVEHPLYLIGIRQVPWLGMHIGSFVPGAAGVNWRRFLWCSAIGTFPGSLLMTAIGAGIVHWS